MFASLPFYSNELSNLGYRVDQTNGVGRVQSVILRDPLWGQQCLIVYTDTVGMLSCYVLLDVATGRIMIMII